MRGSRPAVAAMLLVCVIAAAACDLPWVRGSSRQDRPSAVVAWWSAEPSPVAAFAASEIARYLAAMSGRTVSPRAGALTGPALDRVSAVVVVLTGRPAAAAAGQGGAVRLDAGPVAGLAAGLGTAAADAFAAGLADPDRAVLVAADPRGILYAAYDFLERLGVRFFAPDFGSYRGHAEAVPRRPLGLPVYQTAQQAGMTLRVIDLDESWSVSAETLGQLLDWMGKARMNVLAVATNLEGAGITTYDTWRELLLTLVAERGIELEVGQHGYQDWVPSSRYPQYYQAGYSVFDITNDQAVATYVAAVVAYLVARPEIAVFDCWPPDSTTWPPAVVKRFGSASNAQAYLVGRLTTALAARLPAVRVETIAYQATQEPPTAPYGYDPRRNIVDIVIGRSYVSSLAAPSMARAAGVVERWRRAFSGDVGAYEYYRRYAFRSLPFPLPDVIGGDLRWYHELGVTGIRTYGEPGDWIAYELTHLQVAAMAWDPGQDPAALLTGYLDDRFGPAADGVRRYLRAAESASQAEFGGGSQVELAAATNGYGSATADLVEAASAATPSSDGSFLIERLRWNADFAVADARLTAGLAAGDAVSALQAQIAGAALLQAHRLDGIFVDNPRYSQYGLGSRSGQEYVREYGAGVAFVEPHGSVTVAPGAALRVQVTADAPDLADHRVSWSLSGGAGLALSPSSGVLTVRAGSPASTTVTITAGHDARRVHLVLSARSGSDAWTSSGLEVVVAGPGNLAPFRDSVAVTADGATHGAAFDAHGCGYSQQALAGAGVTSGGRLIVDGLSASWPATGGAPDNVVSRGETVTLPPGTRGSRLVLVASAAPGDALGAGWVTYADGSRAYYQVHVPDWTLSAGWSDLTGTITVVAQSAYHTCAAPAAGPAYVYAIEVPLDRSRDVSAVTLPTSFGTSLLHVFGLVVG